MEVRLSPELHDWVLSKVKSGLYDSADEVVREALRLLEERDSGLHARREEIREKIAEGAEALRNGEVVDGEEVFAELESKLKAMEKSRQAG